MKAYFTASVVGKKQYLDKYLSIIHLLEKSGVDASAEHILSATEDKIRLETRNERVALQKKLETLINDADFLVAETSFPSISVGYEIALALHRGKPVLVLYNQGDSPSLIVNNEEEKLVVEKYTEASLPTIIADFINFVRGGADTRFTFFITSEIGSYLERMGKKTKVPKSVYLRNLIAEDMKKNK